ncbi:MAG: glycosyltransferase family 39 protein [Planctomycetota bacterium]|nr:glycosyltransferase family 39 protein [Planctomycetota bacterium]
MLLLGLIVCLATVLRVAQMRESLWLDELHTAWTVADGADKIVPRAHAGNQSPAYFWLVWGESQMLGLSEGTLRLPSIVAGVALVLVFFFVVQRWTDSRSAALLAALLAALDRNCIFYSQEARPYACVQLVGLGQLLIFWSLLTTPTRWRRVGFVVSSWVLFYLHYTSALLIAGELLAYLILAMRPNWRPVYRPTQLVLDLGTWLLGCLPALPHLVEIAARRTNWELFIPRQPLWGVWTIFPLTRYLVLPAAICGAAWGWRVLRTGREMTSAFALPPLTPTLSPEYRGEGVILRPCLGRRSAAVRPVDDSRCCIGNRGAPPVLSWDLRNLILVLAWLFVPLLLAWGCTYFDIARLFFLRYVIGAAVAPIGFTCLCFAACPGRRSRLATAAAVTITVVWQGGMIDQFRYDGRILGDRNQDWRAAVAALNFHLRPLQLPVFVRSGLIEADALGTRPEPWLREYCLLPVTGIYRVTGDSRDLTPLPTSRTGKLGEADRQRILAAGGAWFVVLGRPESVLRISQDLLSGWGRRRPEIRRESFGDVALLQLTLEPKPMESGR